MLAEPAVEQRCAGNLLLDLCDDVVLPLMGKVRHGDVGVAAIREHERAGASVDPEDVDVARSRRDEIVRLEDRPLALEIGERRDDPQRHLVTQLAP